MILPECNSFVFLSFSSSSNWDIGYWDARIKEVCKMLLVFQFFIRGNYSILFFMFLK